MYGPVAQPQPQPHGRRTRGVPLAVTLALALGALTPAAAFGALGAADTPANAFGTVLRSVLGVEGACCLAGGVLLMLRQPVGRALAVVGGAVALALPLLMVPLIVVAPSEFASGIRQAGGLLVPLVLFALGPSTMAASLRCDVRGDGSR